MKIEKGNDNELIISDNIKSIDDSMAIKTAVQALISAGATSVRLRITSSFSMPSAVIGYLIKLVHQDRIRLSLLVGDKRLYELLDELQLVETFGVTCSKG